MNPKVSIITICFNSALTISDSIESVLSQNYPNIEYIVVDGGSSDGTIEIVNKYKDSISVFISESDNGIYDALNKGILNSTGDVIATLHSDDQFCNMNVVSAQMKNLSENHAEFGFSDMIIVDKLSNKILRYYMSSFFYRGLFRVGWMPPHPTCFIKKSLFDEFGLYSTKYKIAGDFDFFIRIFYGRSIRWTYLNQISVKMAHGGESNSGWKSKGLIVTEISRSLKSNGIWSLTVFQLGRYLIRLLEMLIKPRKGQL
jgi:glycosyltransferase involved in cell wall biosynthesis